VRVNSESFSDADVKLLETILESMCSKVEDSIKSLTMELRVATCREVK
jgi:hypothetical protein